MAEVRPNGHKNLLTNKACFGCTIACGRIAHIDLQEVRLDQPIHETGTYLVEIEVPGGETAKVKTIIAEQR